MYCKNCGHEVTEKSLYCENCKEILIPVEKFEEKISKTDQGINLKHSLLLIGLYIVAFYVIGQALTIPIAIIFMILGIETTHEALMLAISNFLIYLTLAGALIPFSIKFFKHDIIKFGQNLKKNLLIIFIGCIAIIVSTYIVNIIITIILLIGNKVGIIGDKYVDPNATSENQQLIISMMTNSFYSAILTIIPTVIMAPILEEIVFRKALFGLSNKLPILRVFIVSIIFASIHVTSGILTNSLNVLIGTDTIDSVLVEMIYFFSYFSGALILSFAYYLSDYNILVTIAIHFFNNLISTLEIYLLFAAGNI